MNRRDSTNKLLALTIRKTDVAEITHMAQHFVISKFNCESSVDVKQVFVKHCMDAPELSAGMKVEDIGIFYNLRYGISLFVAKGVH